MRESYEKSGPANLPEPERDIYLGHALNTNHKPLQQPKGLLIRAALSLPAWGAIKAIVRLVSVDILVKKNPVEKPVL
jgi:hypothetical protein